MSTPAALPPEETTPALSEGQRVLYTFTAPSQTMADIRRNASWWVPWLLISIFALGFAFTLDKRIGWDQVMENQLQSNPKAAEKMEKVPADQREKILKLQTNVARGFSYATPVITVIFIAVIGGIVLGVFNFGFGAKLKFSQAMSITAYSMLPGRARRGLGQRVQRAGDELQIGAAAVAVGTAPGEEPGLLQHPQVVREQVRRHREHGRQVRRGRIACAESVDDVQPGRVGQRRVHSGPARQFRSYLNIHCLNLD